MKILTTTTFLRRLRELLKTYPHVIADIEPLIKLLKRGETPGDRLQRAGGRAIFKVRAPNQDAQSGKRGGYRVLYYLVDQDQRLLLTLYSKSERADISADELLRILAEWETDQV
jgi:mRNA-degrading endonuclease RelE of RelBE toxin-antitoxin system